MWSVKEYTVVDSELVILIIPWKIYKVVSVGLKTEIFIFCGLS